MSRKLDKLSKTPKQEAAYKSAKAEFQQKASIIAKQTVNDALNKSKHFSGFAAMRSVPLAWMKQKVYRQGWEKTLGKYLIAPDSHLPANPVRHAVANFALLGAVVGMALGAVVSFAATGGTVPIAALFGGLIAAGIGGISNGAYVFNRQKELTKAFDKGKKDAEKSKPVALLALEKIAIEREVEVNAEQRRKEEEISKLNAEAEAKMKKGGKNKSFVADEVARTERADEQLAVNAA